MYIHATLTNKLPEIVESWGTSRYGMSQAPVAIEYMGEVHCLQGFVFAGHINVVGRIHACRVTAMSI